MDKEEIKSLIDEKRDLYGELNYRELKLVDLKTEVKDHSHDLWLNTIWEDVIDGKATEKLKKAYVDSFLRESQESVEKCENEINGLKREIDIINDTLKYLGANDD